MKREWISNGTSKLGNHSIDRSSAISEKTGWAARYLDRCGYMISTDKLRLLRLALSRDRTLFTVQRSASHSNVDSVRVDCFTSKGADSPGLMRITDLVAGTLGYRKSSRGLILNKGEKVEYTLVAKLSKKLKLDLKHERII